MLEIMQKYGWDYYTYQNQPYWVLDLARKKLGMEAKLSANAAQNIQPQDG